VVTSPPLQKPSHIHETCNVPAIQESKFSVCGIVFDGGCDGRGCGCHIFWPYAQPSHTHNRYKFVTVSLLKPFHLQNRRAAVLEVKRKYPLEFLESSMVCGMLFQPRFYFVFIYFISNSKRRNEVGGLSYETSRQNNSESPPRDFDLGSRAVSGSARPFLLFSGHRKPRRWSPTQILRTSGVHL
jgi:hypothetical protein